MPSRKQISNEARASLRFALFVFVFALGLIGAPSFAHAGAWPEHLAKISKLRSEVDALESEIKHMIHSKREAHAESEVRAITEEIAVKYKSLKTAAEKLEEETAHVRFKHPEQADQLDRKYSRHQLKSIDDLESEVGIDGRLDRIKRRVAETFPTPEQKRQLTEAPKINSFFVRKPASLEDEDEAPEKIVLKK